MTRRRLAAASFVVWCAAAQGAGTDTGWRPLWNGRDLTGWETFLSQPDPAWIVPGLALDSDRAIGVDRDPLGVFTVANVDGRAALRVSGQGFGVMTTRETFERFHLRLQFKWGEKRWGKKATAARDSGLLYSGHGEPGEIDGNWPRSVEFQIQEHDTGDLWALGVRVSAAALRLEATPLHRYDEKGEWVSFERGTLAGNRCLKHADHERPNGEWNTLELFSVGDRSIHVVNGVVVMRLRDTRRLDGAQPAPLGSGRISLQTEGAELFYRDIEIRPINAFPPGLAGPAN